MYGVKENDKLIACFESLDDARLFAHCLDPLKRSPQLMLEDIALDERILKKFLEHAQSLDW